MIRRTAIAALVSLGLFAFGAGAQAATNLRIGVTAGLHAETLEQVVKFAKEKGLNIKIFEFQDYVQPNAALASGDLDVNIFQTKPFLEAACRDRGYKLTPVGKTLTFPLGVYSKKIKNVSELKNGAKIGIPNDPSQGGRALILLAANGLIKLKDPSNLLSNVIDIVENPHKFKFVELEAAQLPHSLPDLDAAAINGNYANQAGLKPGRDTILCEGADSPYANYIVVREKDKDAPWVKPLVESYQRPEIAEFIRKKYDGAVIPAF